MSCKICGRQSCTESFHSIEEQEDIDKIQSDGAVDLLVENKTLKQQRDDLLEACEKAFEESRNPKVEKILEAAIAKATHKP